MPADPHLPDFQSSFRTLSEQLACPACHGELQLEAHRLACSGCGKGYPIVGGIPILIPDHPQSK